jgi:hypothetical protein
MYPKERPAQVDSALPDRKGVTLLSAYVVMLSLVPGKLGPSIFVVFIKHIREDPLKQFRPFLLMTHLLAICLYDHIYILFSSLFPCN